MIAGAGFGGSDIDELTELGAELRSAHSSGGGVRVRELTPRGTS